MRIITVLIMVIISPFISNCQGRNNLWMLGYYPDPLGKANIEFSSGTPVITPVNRSIKLSLTLANITDSNGNLLFYTNGAVVANKLDIVMPNGDSLSPATYTFSGAWQYYGFPIPQASLIIPDPGDSSRYYLFHSSVDVLSNGAQAPLHLYYSIIDMDADSGLGDVISKNNILISDTVAGGNILACKHANGRDWWLIEPEFTSTGYYIFLLSPNGVQLINKQIFMQRFGGDGQSKFNLQGTKYARYDTTNDLDVFDFDR